MSEECCTEDGVIAPENDSVLDKFRDYVPATISGVILIAGLVLEQFKPNLFSGNWQPIVYGVSYLIIGSPVVSKAVKKLFTKDIFNEFFLMTLATVVKHCRTPPKFA